MTSIRPMKIIGIEQITKKDIPLHYRNEYSAVANAEFLPENTSSIPIVFSVEVEPSGSRKIQVNVTEAIDYPLLPFIRSLKEEICRLAETGELP